MRYTLLKLLPKNLISRFAGIVADAKVPAPLLLSFIRLYCLFYKVRTHEIMKRLDEFKTFNEFFTRELKPEMRRIDAEPDTVVSPVDGAIAEFGEIKHNLLLQTKGVYYSLDDLVGEKAAQRFNDGFYITIYLSPSDYHRIHSHVSGKLKEFSYFSGKLWPVNRFGVKHVGGLFSLNERIVSCIETEAGMTAMVKVGAMIVGRITLDYSGLASNASHNTQMSLPVVPPRVYRKGDEIGQFKLGSTVILLFEKEIFKPEDLFQGKVIQMGQSIGRI